MKRKSRCSRQQTSKSIPRLRLFWNYFWAFFAGAATLFGILSYIHPNISVTPLVEIDTTRPFSMQFIVTNNGYLTMHGVKYACAIDKIKGRISIESYGGQPGINQSSPRLIAPQHETKKSLGPNHSDTVGIDFEILKEVEPIEVADIGIIVSFYLGFIPIRKERIYHFVTRNTADGNLKWFPKPIDE